MKRNASLFSVILGFTLIACLPAAQAQWSWKDANGGRVFSDQPPPPNVADKDILKRPAGAKAIAATSSEATTSTLAATATTATLPKISGKDSELEKKKKEAETKEAALKKAESDKASAARKDNCDRAKRTKASFDSGTRISTTNAKGEREIMDDATRASEAKRLDSIIASDCS